MGTFKKEIGQWLSPKKDWPESLGIMKKHFSFVKSGKGKNYQTRIYSCLFSNPAALGILQKQPACPGSLNLMYLLVKHTSKCILESRMRQDLRELLELRKKKKRRKAR